MIEWTTSSFYLKNLYKPPQSAKVSIRGPDSNHVGKQHFRFDLTKPKELEAATLEAVYAASKAAVASLGEGLRSERIPGVDVTVIYPGLIRSEISAHMEGNKMMVDTVDGVRAIVAAVERRRAKAYIPPWPYVAVAAVLKFAPLSVVRRLL